MWAKDNKGMFAQGLTLEHPTVLKRCAEHHPTKFGFHLWIRFEVGCAEIKGIGCDVDRFDAFRQRGRTRSEIRMEGLQRSIEIFCNFAVDQNDKINITFLWIKFAKRE